MGYIKFVEYVKSFYGSRGIYPMGVTESDIVRATELLVGRTGVENFCGDSLDREAVRDILIDEMGYAFPR